MKSKTNIEWKKTLVKDLVMLTAVDGDMDEDEIKLVLSIAVNELGFSEKEFVDLMQNLGNVKDIYPSNANDKLEYIASLLRMTYSDGFLDDNEMKYMKIIAKRMHLPDDAIDKAIAYIENSTRMVSPTSTDEDAYSDDSSVGQIIITSPYEPTADVQSENGVKNYYSKISKLSQLELCIELSNVMAAKHNKMTIPSSLGSFSETQKVVTDLTDKALLLCFVRFGREEVLNYCKKDTSIFNQLINEVDEKVAQLQLAPAAHGKKMFNLILRYFL
ncbi:MAG: TerB family tellurite resistance protein [Erysipelotrichia bacterium]|nr:TerB family tellurite resistance protein [Erysipelotrichia bacterium]